MAGTAAAAVTSSMMMCAPRGGRQRTPPKKPLNFDLCHKTSSRCSCECREIYISRQATVICRNSRTPPYEPPPSSAGILHGKTRRMARKPLPSDTGTPIQVAFSKSAANIQWKIDFHITSLTTSHAHTHWHLTGRQRIPVFSQDYPPQASTYSSTANDSTSQPARSIQCMSGIATREEAIFEKVTLLCRVLNERKAGGAGPR